MEGGSSGFFEINSTCVNPPFYDTSNQFSCYLDVDFLATNSGGNARERLSIFAQPSVWDGGSIAYGTQLGTVELSATVIGHNCSAAAISTDVAPPQGAGTDITVSASSSSCGDASPLYRFYLRSPEGAWTDVQDFSTSPTFVWHTTGSEPGTYLIGLWVRDAKSANTYDAYALATYSISVAGCSSANVASDVASPQSAGTTVNFSATSTGCSSSTYQWWVRDTTGSWSIVPGYDFAHSSATLAWNTTGLGAGTYQVGVWARQAGSATSYDAYSFTTYVVTSGGSGAACQAVNVSAGPGSPSASGSAVTLTATSTGCTNPEYRWWVRDPAGHWATVQNYPGSGTFSWSTSSLAAGTYQLGVWARQSGSSASYEAYSFVTYTLTPNSVPCSSVAIAPAVASPQAQGTSITLNAAAAGCGSPEYRFWVARPGEPFAPITAYGPSNAFVWDTSGLGPGTYQVGVWARQSGSGSAYEAYGISTIQLIVTPAPSPCTYLGVSSRTADGQPSTLRPTGSTIYWGVGTEGCAGDYEFFLEGPGSSRQLVQPASSSADFVWNSAGYPAGNYKILVLFRSQGASWFDLFGRSDFELI
jgi:hypothetical protein